jgi:RimJ/RimL family protein N-acetyltransferase
MQPIFETRRPIVRPRTEADTELCFAMDSDPEVTRFVTGPWSDQQEHRAFIEARTRGPYPEGMGYWAVCLRKQPDRFIGWVLLIPIDAVGPEVEIGWRMRRVLGAGGYATEAARAVLTHAFKRLGLMEVVADLDPDNVGSRRVAEKIGLKAGLPRLHHGRTAIRYRASAATREL